MCNHCLNPSCVAACPSGAIYKRGRRRHRAGESGKVPGLAHVCLRLSIQEGVFQLEQRQSGKMHPLLSAHGNGRGARVYAFLRGKDPLPRGVAVRRGPHRGNRLEAGVRAGGGPEGDDPRSVRSGSDSRGSQERHRPEDRGIRPEIAGLQICKAVANGAASSSGMANAADAVLCTAAAAGNSHIEPAGLLRNGDGLLQLARKRPPANPLHGKPFFGWR